PCLLAVWSGSLGHDAVRALDSFPTRRSSDLPRKRRVRCTRASNGMAPLRGVAYSRCEHAGRTQHRPLRYTPRRLRDYTPCLQRRSEEHTSELQSRENLVCRLLLEKKKK